MQEVGFSIRHGTRLSEGKRAQILRQVHAGMSARQIVEQNQEQWLEAYMVTHSLEDRHAAMMQFMASGPPRDFYVVVNDVTRARDTLRKEQWRHHPDELCSLALWAHKNAADVLIIQFQKVLPGTADAAVVALRGELRYTVFTSLCFGFPHGCPP